MGLGNVRLSMKQAGARLADIGGAPYASLIRAHLGLRLRHDDAWHNAAGVVWTGDKVVQPDF